MRIRLGYVSLSKVLDNVTASSLMTFSHYNKLGKIRGDEKLRKIIKSNFVDLEKILNFNIKNEITFYRLTSALIPLATHKEVDFDYKKEFLNDFIHIGSVIKSNNLRVDSHPDQFCVLASERDETVYSSISILRYHRNMFKYMGIDNAKLILHIGSKGGGKNKAINRFINVFNILDSDIKNMIILENDDKVYNAVNILNLCKKINVPMVLDYHHFKINKCSKKIEDIIEDICNTWNNTNLNPKMHFSTSKNKNKKEMRAHHDYINGDDFIEFIERIKFINRDIDIMLEAKEKDMALFKLVAYLKYKTNYKWIDASTFEI